MQHRTLYLDPTNIKVTGKNYYRERNLRYFQSLEINTRNFSCVVTIEEHGDAMITLYETITKWFWDDRYHIVYLNNWLWNDKFHTIYLSDLFR